MLEGLIARTLPYAPRALVGRVARRYIAGEVYAQAAGTTLLAATATDQVATQLIHANAAGIGKAAGRGRGAEAGAGAAASNGKGRSRTSHTRRTSVSISCHGREPVSSSNVSPIDLPVCCSIQAKSAVFGVTRSRPSPRQERVIV